MTLLVVTYLGVIVSVTGVPGDLSACRAALPDFMAAYGRQAVAMGLPRKGWGAGCVPPGAVVFQGMGV